MPGEKKRKSAGNKRRDQITNSSQKRVARKKKNDVEPSALKTAPAPANMIPEQTPLSFHNPGNSKRRRNIVVTISPNTTHMFIRN